MSDLIRHRPCPECGGPTKPIVYGLPGPELERRARLGHVVLGGCCVSDLSPTHFCPTCRRELEDPKDELELPPFCFGHAREAEGRHAV